ncbi:MAG: competence/damage-inducible protein A [Herpetosiphonaceae bacterium]|nr:competence/damage-inducible protein A [Herpetosiphonaceae bacterium]
MNAEIIAIGTELTLGTTVDTNSAWLAGQLATIGVAVSRVSLVGDDLPALTAMIGEAWARAELVICTGGLGPTADDLTREAVAAATERPLEFHPDLFEQIAARFRSFGRTMSESNRQQAYVPTGALAIPNARGTAPVFIVSEPERALMVLPGVPSEMKFLAETELLPFLRNERGLKSILLVRSVYLSGTSEAEAGEAIADLMQAPYPTVGISAKAAQYEVRISALGEDRQQVEADLAAVVAEVTRRLGRYILNKAGLVAHVVHHLREQNQTLALYEGFREAPVYAALRRVPGGLQSVRGVTIHPLDEPVDAEAAESLARAAAAEVRNDWRADYGLAVIPAQVGADGYTDICLVLTDRHGEQSLCRRVDMASSEAFGFIGNGALEIVRRSLETLQRQE